MAGIRYNYVAITRINREIDALQVQMDTTIKAMKGDVEAVFAGFTGEARTKYDMFVTAFETEKARLYKLLDDYQAGSRQHVAGIAADEAQFAQALGRTTSQIG